MGIFFTHHIAQHKSWERLRFCCVAWHLHWHANAHTLSSARRKILFTVKCQWERSFSLSFSLSRTLFSIGISMLAVFHSLLFFVPIWNAMKFKTDIILNWIPKQNYIFRSAASYHWIRIRWFSHACFHIGKINRAPRCDTIRCDWKCSISLKTTCIGNDFKIEKFEWPERCAVIIR